MAKPRRAKPKRLQPLNILGDAFPIMVARTPDDVKLLGTNEAIFDYGGRRILLNGDYAISALGPNLEHEAGHGVFYKLELHSVLVEQLDLTRAQASKLEELICGQFVAVYLDTLERNGRITRHEFPVDNGDE